MAALSVFNPKCIIFLSYDNYVIYKNSFGKVYHNLATSKSSSVFLLLKMIYNSVIHSILYTYITYITTQINISVWS